MKLKIFLIALAILIHQSSNGAVYPPPSCDDSADSLAVNGAEIHYELSGPSTGQTIVFISAINTGAEILGCYVTFSVRLDIKRY